MQATRKKTAHVHLLKSESGLKLTSETCHQHPCGMERMTPFRVIHSERVNICSNVDLLFGQL